MPGYIELERRFNRIDSEAETSRKDKENLSFQNRSETSLSLRQRPDPNYRDPLSESTTSKSDETILCPHCKQKTPSRYIYCMQCAKRIDQEEVKRRTPSGLRTPDFGEISH